MNDHHEARVLLEILRPRWVEAESLVRERAVDPERFVALAVQCDVHPTVHARLEDAGRFDLVGEDAANRLATLRAKVQADNLLLLARTEAALDALLAVGIDPVALKGLETLHRYHGRFDERTLDDVDLLVPRSDLDRAVNALVSAGWIPPSDAERRHWERTSFELPLTSPGPVSVAFELHWSLGQTGRYAVDIDGILGRTLRFEIEGRSIRRLDPNDAVAHLLMHHLQHFFDRRLKWILDLRKYVREPGFSWQTVAERLRAWGGLSAGAASVRHIGRLFPNAIDDDALRRMPYSAWRRALLRPLRSDHPLDMYRDTRKRAVQLYLASALMDDPWRVPLYAVRRVTRVRGA